MQPVPADGVTLGEVMFRGNIVMKGYLKNQTATAEAFAGGWFHSGDLGVLHPDGYIQIKDRSKDIIISGGENISSIEVEEVLYQHPAVRGLRRRWQGRTRSGAKRRCAFVELKPGMTASDEDMLAHCRNGLAALQMPSSSCSPRSRKPAPARSRNLCCATWRRRCEATARQKFLAARNLLFARD